MARAKDKPNIYTFHDIREFLELWFAYLKDREGKFSLRKLATQSKVSPAYLPLVMAGKRTLTAKSLNKLLPHLGLNKDEQEYLLALRTLSETSKQEERESALKQIQKFKKYKEQNTDDLQAYKYLNQWLHVAIREMSAIKGFNLDPAWIRQHLKRTTPISDIKKATDFLLKEGYLKKTPTGKVSRPDHRISCHGGVYKLSMSQFHTQMLDLAVDFIYKTPSELRNLQSETVAINPSDFGTIRDIMQEALVKIQDVANNSKGPSTVYHITHLAFPLTKTKEPKS